MHVWFFKLTVEFEKGLVVWSFLDVTPFGWILLWRWRVTWVRCSDLIMGRLINPTQPLKNPTQVIGQRISAKWQPRARSRIAPEVSDLPTMRDNKSRLPWGRGCRLRRPTRTNTSGKTYNANRRPRPALWWLFQHCCNIVAEFYHPNPCTPTPLEL
jgi:hypothetical protein